MTSANSEIRRVYRIFAQRSLALVAGLLTGFASGACGNPAEAYRFYDNGALDYIVGSDQALRWSADAWGPGETLVWEIEDGEDWSLLFDSAEEVGPLLDEALAIWSGIETADISWRFASVAALSDERPRFGDSRNGVFLERQHWRDSDGNQRYHYRSGAFLWWKRARERSGWELTECDVGLPWHWWLDDDLQPRTDLDLDDVRATITRFAAEEFGHCLGLGEGAPFPGIPWLRRAAGSEDTVWGSRSIWDWGPFMYSYWAQLSQDDRVAASLLRPRPGWRSSVGSVSGTLKVEGAPVPYVHVYAIRSTPGGMRDPVGAYSNGHGAFLIEGLPPGDYVLWAAPIRDVWGDRPLIEEDAETDVKDAVLAHPIRVEAGAVTDGIEIPMRTGRQ